jgi:hypothetical protein
LPATGTARAKAKGFKYDLTFAKVNPPGYYTMTLKKPSHGANIYAQPETGADLETVGEWVDNFRTVIKGGTLAKKIDLIFTEDTKRGLYNVKNGKGLTIVVQPNLKTGCTVTDVRHWMGALRDGIKTANANAD